MTDCWPPCSPWCTCVNGRCQVRPTTINAVRLTTPDGRFLQVATNGGGLLVASTVAAPGPSETFLFGPGMSGPLASGDSIALRGCDASFAPSGAQVRVDHNVKVLPRGGGKNPPLVTYEVGGAGASVFVSGPFSAGYPAYSGDDPAERNFDILKTGGGPIVDGDAVSLRINSNLGRTFFFRLTGAQEGERVDGDGTSQGAPGTLFIARFNEVQAGAGWRPAIVQCQACAGVVGSVRDQVSHAPVAGALVEALDVLENHPFSGTSGSNGRFSLADSEARTCIPSGPVRLRTTHARHQTKVTGPLTLPTNGFVDVTIDLDCTNVSGVVVDQVDRPVAGVVVALVDTNQMPILGEDGQPLVATTGADGSFVFRCVPHGTVFVWSMNDPAQRHIVVVPPEGVDVKIVTQGPCGALVGTVKDANTLAPIASATVVIIGGASSAPVSTNANGEFRIPCVRPAGQVWVMATATGYVASSAFGTVPMSGDSAPVDLLLQPLHVSAIVIRLDWGALPGDLDLRLTGPDGMGGRFQVLWAFPNPVSFVSLDQDVRTGFGPETITVSPSPLGTFFQGVYRVSVYDVSSFSGGTFDMSNAVVTILTMGAGGMNQIGRFDVANATGMQDLPLWHVCDLDVTTGGGVTVTSVQLLLPGNTVIP